MLFKTLRYLFSRNAPPPNWTPNTAQPFLSHPQPKYQAPKKQVTEPEKPIRHPAPKVLKGKFFVIDGDTIVISGTHIRIAGIDAPELDHPWGKKSKYAMIAMCKGKVVTAVCKDELSYDRIVAQCYLPDGTDLAAELVEQGLALDWPKYSGGAYRHLEPAGIRKKLWRAAARQQGRMKAG